MAKIQEHLRKQRRPAISPTGMVEQKPALSENMFKGRLRAYFFMRLHMTMIFGLMILSGVGASKALLALGLRSMPIRYAIAVCVAYGLFFLLVRLWLWYVGISRMKFRQGKRSSSSDSESGDSSGLDLNVDLPSGGGGSGSGSSWSGFGGGSSGGGGASDNWGQPAFLSSNQSYSSSGSGSGWFSGRSGGSSSSGFGDFSIDGDDGCLGLIVVLLLAALVFAVFGAGAYAIYQAPSILAEAAFQAALASGLIRAAKKIERGDWAGSVFKATVLPLMIVLALAVSFGWAAQHYRPTATKMADIFHAHR